MIHRRSRTNRGAPAALDHAARQLERALERTEQQRRNLLITASTVQHREDADRLHAAADLMGSLLHDAADVLRHALPEKRA